jgi:type VI secretion system protein ImpA
MSLEKWLSDCQADAPCGVALDFDPDFLALEQLTLGKPERQYGDTIIPAEQPDWRAVRSQAEALLAKSKDLRLAVSLLRGNVQAEGLRGMVEPLKLLRHMVDQWWEPVFPLAQIDGESDPYMRANAIALLADRDGFLKELRNALFIESRGMRVLMKDAEIALGVQEVAAGGQITRDQLTGLMGEAFEADATVFENANTCGALLVEINQICQQKFGPQNAPDLVGILRLFSTLTAAIDGVQRTAAGEDVAASPQSLSATGEEGSPYAIKNRADAIRSIDAICRFFEQNEPANPAPIFLKRAKKLVGMSFLDIIKDMAPDSLPRIGIISGENNES